MADTKGVLSGDCLAEGRVPSRAVCGMAEHWLEGGRNS
jgi:hypothetical protein